MGLEASVKKYSIEEYLQLEAESEIRHEFHQGELFAMAGGTHNHSIIGANVTTELNLLTRTKDCITYNGDMKISLDIAHRFVYPEAAVVCGEAVFSEFTSHAITNPMLVAEVLSESTEAYDRGAKFMFYQQIPSFREYLLLDQTQPLVNVFFRREPEIWEMRTYLGLDQEIFLQSMDARLLMTDLYRGATDLKAPLSGA